MSSTMRLPMAMVRILVERPVVAEGGEEQLQRLRFNEPVLGRVVDDEVREIGLAGHRAQAGELGRGEAGDVVGIRVRIWHALERRLVRRLGIFVADPRIVTGLSSWPMLRRSHARLLRCVAQSGRAGVDAALVAAIARDLDLGEPRHAVLQPVP